ISQWERQIEYFSETANVLAVDLVGCGDSEVVAGWKPYTTDSILQDLVTLLTTRYRSSSTILIAHSYGCTFACLLAIHPSVCSQVRAVVLIAPKSHITPAEKKNMRVLRWCPDWFIDGLRISDRKGGINSKSVKRLLGEQAEEDLRRRQLRWNLMSRTSVWRRTVVGMRIPGKEEWEQIRVPVLLVGGKEDKIVPNQDMFIIRDWLLHSPLNNLVAKENIDTASASPSSSPNTQLLPHVRVPIPYIIRNAGHQVMLEKPELVNPIISEEFLIKTCGFEVMSPAWQILHKTQGENKWDLKNFEKIMRQNDPEHSPAAFIAQHPEIGYIIDFSHESPPYRPSDFDGSNIRYIKLSTLSKIPPAREDVTYFIERVRDCWRERPEAHVAVHCHYGFNRTGFVICCYLIQELGVSVSDALRYFAEARPPGIRHTHFKDELFLRYALPERSETGDTEDRDRRQ
ncbi:hypothetical protein BC937DRAFT_93793, partial [Endogone sp. FLAS-F59071]